MQLVDALTATAVFHDADPARLAATAALWTERALRPRQMLWYENQPADELALVVEGELEVTSGERRISAVGAGELIGEASAFITGEVRTLSVRAAQPSRLLVLEQGALAGLRRSHEDVYDLLLERALLTLAERVEATLGRIAELGRGELRASLLGVTQTGVESPQRTLPPTREPASPVPAMRLLPVLSGAPDSALSRIRFAMTPHLLERGELLIREGDLGHALYLVAEGEVEVLKAVVGQPPLRLAGLGTGALVGTGGLLLGHPRNASCTAVRESWVYAISRESFRALRGEPGRLFREALMCALRTQVKSASQKLAALGAVDSRNPQSDRSLDELLSAAGTAVVFQAGEGLPELEPASLPLQDELRPASEAKRRLLEYVRSSIIGADEAIETPYGLLRITYADYAASGRNLSFIEDFIQHEVMPFYGNTHTEDSGTGRQTTRYREDARELIRECTGADARDAVIFCGSGATGAINKLIDILGLRIPADLDQKWKLGAQIPAAQRPVVFIGPYEHHSNMLPWIHSIADVVVIDDDASGRIDLASLERSLITYRDRPLRIGSFSAASNVTGILSDAAAISTLLHRHGALSFWDYAAAGPHAGIDMNLREEGTDGHLAYKDAVFLSPHKFMGGPGSPGVLIVKRRLVENSVPSQPGGGTVALVTPETAIYYDVEEQREEGGTPAIIESIRAGLAFQLKRAVGTDTIAEMEHAFLQRAIEVWRTNPNLRILADGSERISIVSFMVRYRHHYLHHNFVVTLLNDLFGVQARGGCSCAGPYMHRLLGLGPEYSERYVRMVEKGYLSLKPGWSRINFNYCISHDEFRYVVAAVNLVARYGCLLLPHYELDPKSGQWHHRRGQPHVPMRLHDVRYTSGRLEYPSRHVRLPEEVLEKQIENALRVFEAARRDRRQPPEGLARDDEYERLRWFALPDEVARDLDLERGDQPGRADTPRDYRVRTYMDALAAAYGSGRVSPEAVAVLHTVRRSLRITPEEHSSACAAAGIA